MSLFFNVLVLSPLGALAMVKAIRSVRRRVTDPDARRRLGLGLVAGSSVALVGLFVLRPWPDPSPLQLSLIYTTVMVLFGALFTGGALLEKRDRK